MQTIYAIVQLRSNIHHENGTLHYKYDLEAKLALVINTKVVPHNILSMFEAFIRFHNHFIHCLYVTLGQLSISSLRSLVR